jgi:carboxylesterase type B
MMFALILILPCIITGEESVEVTTEYGKVLGSIRQTSSNSVSYASFQGIPFAAPPVGELRLKPPIIPKQWNVTKDVTGNSSKVCPQLSSATSGDVIGEEDCLYLNVYTPAITKGMQGYD